MSVLKQPFEATAFLRLDRFGPLATPGMPSRLQLEVGGYLIVYVGRKGTGNLDPTALQDPPPGKGFHPSQLIGGAFRARDRVELLNLSVRALQLMKDKGLLESALDCLVEAESRGDRPVYNKGVVPP